MENDPLSLYGQAAGQHQQAQPYDLAFIHGF